MQKVALLPIPKDSPAPAPTLTLTKEAKMKNADEIYQEAHTAGYAAGKNARTAAMIVGEPTTPFGSDVDMSKETYFVADGPCGFVKINIRPARGKFVKYLKENDLGYSDSYFGGYSMPIHQFGQSLQRKEAYGYAFRDILTSYGISAQTMSQMD